MGSDGTMEGVRFLLLMRHAKHTAVGKPAAESNPESQLQEIVSALRKLTNTPIPVPTNVQSSTSGPVRRELSIEGRTETKAVAERLKEYTEEWREPFELAGIITSDSDEAMATAAVVKEEFPKAALKEVPFLTPRVAFGTPPFKRSGAPALAEKLKGDVSCLAERLVATGEGEGNAILLVGHQPILGWLGHAFVGEAHPQANSEVLCLDLDGPGPAGLCWTVSPSDQVAVVELKEKIRSKMDVAKLLSSFLGGGLSFLLATMANRAAVEGLYGHIWAFAAGSLALFAALGCFLWTMCSYDTLLMPHRMWTETPRGSNARPAWLVGRPPSPVQWILYQNMMRVWQWQFLPATALMLAGFWMLISAVFGVRLIQSSCVAGAYYCFLAALGMAIIAAKGWQHRRDFRSAAACPGVTSKVRHLCGPWLGSED
jgi:phosphohistidine phosphatase SixA